MNIQDIKLYHGRKTIRIFTDQVTTVAVHQNLGNLVVKLENSIKYLEVAQFTHKECKRIWGKSWMEDKSQELCTENIAAINEFIRQALNPVETLEPECFMRHQNQPHNILINTRRVGQE